LDPRIYSKGEITMSMNMSYDEIAEKMKDLLEPEFAQKWPHASTTTVSVEVDNLIEKTANNIDELTVNGLFDVCIKQI
jgi:hypothetical protein